MPSNPGLVCRFIEYCIVVGVGVGVGPTAVAVGVGVGVEVGVGVGTIVVAVGVGGTGVAVGVGGTPEEKKIEEPVPEEKPYKPDLFILSGKKPKAPSSRTSDSVLGQALGTTTGLTASRGAGEIEDPSTGKKRKKVWNEETLRLKDALGV